MKQKEVESLFNLAGIEILDIKPLVDGYGFSPNDSRFYQTLPRCVWWFVKTSRGWVEIGWRKRVISINWKDTDLRFSITDDDTTKEETCVHAWSIEKALEYLKTLAGAIDVLRTSNVST